MEKSKISPVESLAVSKDTPDSLGETKHNEKDKELFLNFITKDNNNYYKNNDNVCSKMKCNEVGDILKSEDGFESDDQRTVDVTEEKSTKNTLQENNSERIIKDKKIEIKDNLENIEKVDKERIKENEFKNINDIKDKCNKKEIDKNIDKSNEMDVDSNDKIIKDNNNEIVDNIVNSKNNERTNIDVKMKEKGAKSDRDRTKAILNYFTRIKDQTKNGNDRVLKAFDTIVVDSDSGSENLDDLSANLKSRNNDDLEMADVDDFNVASVIKNVTESINLVKNVLNNKNDDVAKITNNKMKLVKDKIDYIGKTGSLNNPGIVNRRVVSIFGSSQKPKRSTERDLRGYFKKLPPDVEAMVSEVERQSIPGNDMTSLLNKLSNGGLMMYPCPTSKSSAKAVKKSGKKVDIEHAVLQNLAACGTQITFSNGKNPETVRSLQNTSSYKPDVSIFLKDENSEDEEVPQDLSVSKKKISSSSVAQKPVVSKPVPVVSNSDVKQPAVPVVSNSDVKQPAVVVKNSDIKQLAVVVKNSDIKQPAVVVKNSDVKQPAVVVKNSDIKQPAVSVVSNSDIKQPAVPVKVETKSHHKSSSKNAGYEFSPELDQQLNKENTVMEVPSFLTPFVIETPPTHNLKHCLKKLKENVKEPPPVPSSTRNPDEEDDIATKNIVEEISKLNPSEKDSEFFSSSLGKFFMEIGFNLVQEFVQKDLIKGQKSRMKNKPRILQSDLASLERSYEATKKRNITFKCPMKKCDFCNFASESDLILRKHLDSPHLLKQAYCCNFCSYQTQSRNMTEFNHHMIAEHGITPPIHERYTNMECTNCEFNCKNKKTLEKHIVYCSKEFDEATNLIPGSSWEPPAKLSKIHSQLSLLHQSLEGFNLKNGTSLIPGSTTNVSSTTAQVLVQQRLGNMSTSSNQQRNSPAISSSSNAVNPLLNLAPPPPVTTSSKSKSKSHGISKRQNYDVLLKSQMTALMGSLFSETDPKKIRETMQRIQLIESLIKAPVVANVGSSAPAPAPSVDIVVCEICDGYLNGKSELRSHLMVMHNVKIHPRMLNQKPNLNCEKCEKRFYTDQGLERHLLGSHGLVSKMLQNAACTGQDAGRCPMCGKFLAGGLLAHVSDVHRTVLRPAFLSYKCTVCTATFPAYSLFETHVYTEHKTALSSH